MSAAACRDLDSSIFFDQDARSIAAAKAVCRRCPVRTACNDHAFNEGERHGTWAGLSERERLRARRKRWKMNAQERSA